MLADLHCHSLKSDGQLSPSDLVDRAAEQGVAGAEFDLQLTRDGVLVLLHDDTLRRTGVPIRRPGDESSSDFDSYEESLP